MKGREILLLSIGIFLTVVTLVITDIYNLRTSTQLKESLEKGKQIELKSYKINIELLDVLEKRRE